MVKEITYKPFGYSAILVEWEPIIQKSTLNEIIAFKEHITSQKKTTIEDCVVGYNSLTIFYTIPISNLQQEINTLQQLYEVSKVREKETKNYTWEIPVCYDVEFGLDLESFSEFKNISIEEVIYKHTNQVYTVYFIGFLPGFLYLGGLEPTLYMARKPSPRLRVAKGSVAIGGNQTGIYPSDSPGGWNIIGKTPISFFDIQSSPPCFAKPGDQIKFVSISKATFHSIAKQIKNQEYTLQKTEFHD